ncbi:MAG: LegC family aminotransferase [Sphingorhabdus sp.]|nr:LegC family aminotransferase [Sphingorhabdus sp.]
MTSTTSDPIRRDAAVSSTATLDVAAIVAAVANVLPGPAALHEPTMRGREWDYVKECLDSGWVSYAGQYVERFERMLEQVTGARHAVAMASGTAALHMGLIVCGIRHRDEVLVPAFTFVATANAVAHAGAVPHFVESDSATLGVSPGLLDEYLSRIADQKDGQCINRRTGCRIAAIIPMHVFGHPVDMDALNDVAERHNLVVIEDAAESLGSSYKGRSTGTFGRVAALSFNGNKIITTGGGGALLTDDPELARHARHLSTTAKLPHKWEFRHDEIAYNYRMPSLNAALGCAQLEQLPGFVTAKRRLAEKYGVVLDEVAGIRFLREPAFASSNYWLNAILLQPKIANDCVNRDSLLAAFNAAGIMARPAWSLMHHLPMYSDCPRMDLPVAESLERRIVNLPSSVSLVEPV